MLAYCGRPAAASSGDRFPYIVPAMRGKRSPEAARRGSPSLRRSLLGQAPRLESDRHCRRDLQMSQPPPSRESLQALLARVHERLGEAGSVDPESRELLRQVMGDIDRAL